MTAPGPEILTRLYDVIRSRRGADPAQSYTASLFAQGPAHIARKVGEESIETMLEALAGARERVASESADLLYHLLVLWAEAGVTPEEVWAELAKREGTSGGQKG